MTNQIPRETHLSFLHRTLALAALSPSRPTNFRVGCIIVSYSDPVAPIVLATGYTLESPGNTHAEECALEKIQVQRGKTGQRDRHDAGLFAAEERVVLYTSLEPCGLRLSGKEACVRRIMATRSKDGQGGVSRVVFGAREPGTFVKDSQSCTIMTEAGIAWDYLPEFEEEILKIAKAGHVQESDCPADPNTTLDTAAQLRPRQPDQPPNRKKRMM